MLLIFTKYFIMFKNIFQNIIIFFKMFEYFILFKIESGPGEILFTHSVSLNGLGDNDLGSPISITLAFETWSGFLILRSFFVVVSIIFLCFLCVGKFPSCLYFIFIVFINYFIIFLYFLWKILNFFLKKPEI